MSQRQTEDVTLKSEISSIHKESRGTYGSPRIQRELLERGFRLGRNRIRRLMREQGIMGIHRRRFHCLTKRDERHPVAENHLERNFEASRPNQKWVADITYIRTAEGWLYLAVVLDLFSRRVVGWSMSPHLDTDIVENALSMAVRSRNPGEGVIHHSDRGCQYTSHRFRQRLRDAGIECSMSGTGNCYDNAACESFFATLKTECVYRTSFRTRATAKAAVFDFIECFYNRERRHSSIGYLSPVRYEEAAALAA